MDGDTSPRTPPGATTGARYGALTVVRVMTFGRKANVEFKCDCGALETKRLDGVKRAVSKGHAPTCKTCHGDVKRTRGLKKFEPERYIAKTFGRLLVTGIDVDPSRNRVKSRLVCRCECGGQAIVTPRNLLDGKTTSCGCFHQERLVEVGRESVIHGHTTHGVLNGHTPLYRAWMKIRAGVKEGWRSGHHLVCHEYDPRWDVYENFLADFGAIGVRETISRRDNQLPWSKDNCFVNIGRRAKITAGADNRKK